MTYNSCPICGKPLKLGHRCSESFCRARDRVMKQEDRKERPPTEPQRLEDGFLIQHLSERNGE